MYYFPDLEEEENAVNYHMEDFQGCTQVPSQGTWRYNHGNQGQNYHSFDRPGYKNKDQGSLRTRGPPANESRDAKIEAILNQSSKRRSVLVTQRDEPRDAPREQHNEQCIAPPSQHNEVREALETPHPGMHAMDEGENSGNPNEKN
ncbi:hypothetical protein HAX54_018648 [Datura stramonium]|uniref:Uncharacterized protein n=1 Tax=Datura stramonium TaxID=4076 RepID=A0ABS8UPR5_DATST|nr:hypothetical protein [Datura stramonium]